MTTQTTASTLTAKYLKTIGILTQNAVGRGFTSPIDLAIGKHGRIHVLSRRRQVTRVGVCTLDDEHLYEFGTYGDEPGQFKLPSALALDRQDSAYVADEYHHRVSVFDSSGEFQGDWGTFGNGDGQLDGPSGLAFDADDNLYLVDQNNHRVQRFTSDGRFLFKWGEFGDGDGQFNQPWGVSVDHQGNVWVADWRNDRIQKFSPEGRFLASYGESGDGDGQFHRPSNAVVDPQGNIYVTDWGNQRVQILGADGDYLFKLKGQATLSRWAAEFLDVNPDERIPREESDLLPELPPHLNKPGAVSSQTEPYFWGPAAMAFDLERRLYVVETARHRIQVYQME